MKYFMFIFFLIASFHVFAVQLRLTEINCMGMNATEFQNPSADNFVSNIHCMINGPQYLSLKFMLVDFPSGYSPLNIKGYLDVYCDSEKLDRITPRKNYTFLGRINALKAARNQTEKMHEFYVKGHKALKYMTKNLTITGRLEVNSGKLKCLKYKLSEIPSKGIDGFSFLKQVTPDGKSCKVTVDMGNIKNYYVGIDNITESEPDWRGPFENKEKNTMVFPKSAENDPNLIFTVVYAAEVKKEVINVDFSVPLKWKAIRIPNKKGTVLVPVNSKRKETK